METIVDIWCDERRGLPPKGSANLAVGLVLLLLPR